MQKFLLTFLFSLTLLLGFAPFALAQNTSTTSCDQLKQQFANANASDLAAQFPQICGPNDVYKKITKILYSVVAIVAVIVIIYGGYLYMIAGANEATKKKGRDVLKWAIIGVIVILLAATIVNIVVKLVVENTLF